MTKILFIQPHPDDLELNCGQIMHYLAKKSKNDHQVIIASTTMGEFGLPGAQYDKFKGKFLAKVRKRELTNALALHGIPAENIMFFNYIDGLVPFNRDFITKITKYLQQERPQIIFAPEPLYTYYVHNDHVRTGRAIFYIIHHNLLGYRPKIYFYGSLCPNFYFPFKKKDYELTDQLLACHKTQFWLLNRMRITKPLSARYFGLKLRGWTYAEPFRRVYFEVNNRKKNKPSLVGQAISHFCWSHYTWFDAKYPAELMAKINAERREKK